MDYPVLATEGIIRHENGLLRAEARIHEADVFSMARCPYCRPMLRLLIGELVREELGG
jgi:hypothetical protein